MIDSRRGWRTTAFRDLAPQTGPERDWGDIADELRDLANDLEAEADREIHAELRRRDFSLSTRSLSARLIG